jgi:flagellin-like protein
MGTLAERGPGSAERGVSPVIGVILMVAIVVTMAAVAGVAIFGAQEDGVEPAPNVLMNVDSEEGEFSHTFYHEGGEMLVGDKVTMKGVANPDVMNGKTLTQGDTVEFFPIQDEVKLVFTGENDRGHVLRTFEVDRTVPTPDEGCAYVDSKTGPNDKNDVTFQDIVLNCDIETAGEITIEKDTVVIGDMNSTGSSVTVKQSQTFGSIDGTNDVTVEDGTIRDSVESDQSVTFKSGDVGGDILADEGATLGGSGPVNVSGSVITQTDEITINNDADIEGSVVAENEAVTLKKGSVGGDVVARGGDLVIGGTAYVEVGGDVAVNSGSLDLKSGTDVLGDAYGSISSCSSSPTIDGQSCSTYKPGPSYGAYSGP